MDSHQENVIKKEEKEIGDYQEQKVQDKNKEC